MLGITHGRGLLATILSEGEQAMAEEKIGFKPGEVPIGAIVSYYGRLEWLDFRQWQVCDGKEILTGPLKGTLTPDLDDKFVRGTTNVGVNGDAAGEEEHFHPACKDIGGTFSGTGSGKTLRQSGKKYDFADDDCHPQNEGDRCHTMEWNVEVDVKGTITTHNHSHGPSKHIPRHVRLLFIMRIG
jgi:hypothetical protein